MSPPSTPATEVLTFWFSDRVRKLWFDGNAAFDDEIRTRFQETVDAALSGTLAPWASAADSALALVIVLDQLTRNIFRGTPRAFAGDAGALEVAHACVARGDDEKLTLEQRMFLYMPFQHSERLADQVSSLELFGRWAEDHSADTRAGADEDLRYARIHHDIIARFGRFPHRNVILGRESTPEELAFLKTPESSF